MARNVRFAGRFRTVTEITAPEALILNTEKSDYDTYSAREQREHIRGLSPPKHTLERRIPQRNIIPYKK